MTVARPPAGAVPLTLDFPPTAARPHPAGRARRAQRRRPRRRPAGPGAERVRRPGDAPPSTPTSTCSSCWPTTRPAGRSTVHSPEVDEIRRPWTDRSPSSPFGTEQWWYRWSYAWTPVLLDRTGGELAEAVRRQAALTPEEADAVLIDHDRLDGWINFAYRALKSDRDGRGAGGQARRGGVGAVAARRGLRARRPGASLQQVPALGAAHPPGRRLARRRAARAGRALPRRRRHRRARDLPAGARRVCGVRRAARAHPHHRHDRRLEQRARPVRPPAD